MLEVLNDESVGRQLVRHSDFVIRHCSIEPSLQKPLPIGEASKNPEPRAARRLDPVVIASDKGLAALWIVPRRPPPAGFDPLRSPGIGHSVAAASPAEMRRRPARCNRHNVDSRGLRQEPKRPLIGGERKQTVTADVREVLLRAL